MGEEIREVGQREETKVDRFVDDGQMNGYSGGEDWKR